MFVFSSVNVELGFHRQFFSMAIEIALLDKIIYLQNILIFLSIFITNPKSNALFTWKCSL